MLLLDLGNSSLKAQYWQANELMSSCCLRIETDWPKRFNDYLSSISPQRCYYASVPGSQASDEMLNCLVQKTDLKHPVRLLAKKRCKAVVSAYHEPRRLGIDRWLALLGAASFQPHDAMIIDAGSAITVDLLKANGQHLGGAILPGFKTSLERFRQMLSIADFNHADIEANQLPGCTTESCIHINYSEDLKAYLDHLVARWFNSLAADAVLMVTGGDANLIERHPQHAFLQVPDLVFQGMRQQLESLE